MKKTIIKLLKELIEQIEKGEIMRFDIIDRLHRIEEVIDKK